MRTESTIKQETIIEAALKRLSHFGFAKTTFTDIARDLGITQQSLYYYFPDKKTLIRAVVNNVIEEYVSKLEAVLSGHSPLSKKLRGMVEIKEEFFEKYYMLVTDQPQESFYGNDELAQLMGHTKKRQQQLVAHQLQKAIETKEIRKVNVNKTADLLLDAIDAMQEVLRYHAIIPDEQSIKEVFQKQKELITIYVDGLKNCTCNK